MTQLANIFFLLIKMNTMKYIIFFYFHSALSLGAQSQIDNAKRKMLAKETPKTLSIGNQKYIKGQKVKPAQLLS